MNTETHIAPKMVEFGNGFRGFYFEVENGELLLKNHNFPSLTMKCGFYIRREEAEKTRGEFLPGFYLVNQWGLKEGLESAIVPFSIIDGELFVVQAFEKTVFSLIICTAHRVLNSLMSEDFNKYASLTNEVAQES